MATATIVSKMSVATIRCNASVAKNSSVPILLCTIWGRVSGTKEVVDRLTGLTHHPLTGKFSAINHQRENEKYQSGVLYLPSGIHDMLLSEAQQLKNGAEVKFGLQLFGISSSAPTGYGYQAKSLISPEGIDPLDDIRKLLPDDLTKGHTVNLPFRETGDKNA